MESVGITLLKGDWGSILRAIARGQWLHGAGGGARAAYRSGEANMRHVLQGAGRLRAGLGKVLVAYGTILNGVSFRSDA